MNKPPSTADQPVPYRRRSGDRIRVVVAAVVLTVLAARPSTRTERAITEAFATLPTGLHTLFAALYRLGAVWAIIVLVGTALAVRRWLGRTCTV